MAVVHEILGFYRSHSLAMALRRAAGWLRGSPLTCISTPERDVAVDDELISIPSERCIAIMEDIDSHESPNTPSTRVRMRETRERARRCGAEEDPWLGRCH